MTHEEIFLRVREARRKLMRADYYFVTREWERNNPEKIGAKLLPASPKLLPPSRVEKSLREDIHEAMGLLLELERDLDKA